jgi:hypothetical protein
MNCIELILLHTNWKNFMPICSGGANSYHLVSFNRLLASYIRWDYKTKKMCKKCIIFCPYVVQTFCNCSVQCACMKSINEKCKRAKERATEAVVRDARESCRVYYWITGVINSWNASHRTFLQSVAILWVIEGCGLLTHLSVSLTAGPKL